MNSFLFILSLIRDNQNEKESRKFTNTIFPKWGRDGSHWVYVIYLMLISQPLCFVSKNDSISIIGLHIRCEFLVYVMEESHVYVIVDIY